MLEGNWIEDYLDFYQGTEPPTIFNRWAAISGISTILGRRCYIQHGHAKIYPNQYIMLIGESGSRKSTAIKTFLRPILIDAGYKKFSAKKTSKEKFLEDLHDGMEKIYDEEEHLDVRKQTGNWTGKHNPTMKELFGVSSGEPSECYIAADEFNIFLGHKNIEFIEILTDLWDFDGQYPGRTKTGRPILITDPTINIFGGNTQVGISMSFPIEVIGQGFFARLISVYSEPSGRRITFPQPPDLAIRKSLVERLKRMHADFQGVINIEPFAYVALDEIYQNWKPIDDIRFKSYSERRLTHLLKLCMCCAAATGRKTIDTGIVEYANSILHYTESFMPKALGEFGKSRHSDIAAKILDIVGRAEKGLNPMEDIWPHVNRDCESPQEMVRILMGLKDAGKIQQTDRGVLPYKREQKFDQPHCKISLLREYLESQAKDGLPL